MHPIDEALSKDLGVSPSAASLDEVETSFELAGVDCFACTHTCLPFAQDFIVGGKRKLVINNGSAGMPNFRDTAYGCITRIAAAEMDVHSASTATTTRPLYGTWLDGVRVDAVPLHFDTAAWKQHFVRTHPESSPAYESYWGRIDGGVSFFTVPQADRIRLGE
jgi:hypothetical protein